MLAENLAPLFQAGLFPGAEVEIFVENGEELAPRTLNPRLGIIGGISILGTSGLVKPFSHEAYIATVESALDVARAAGLAEVVFATGRQSEKAVMPTRPDLKPESFIQIADFFGDSLKLASARGFQTIGLAVFFGKAVKQARGLANTHARRHEQEAAILADWLGEADESMAAQLREAMTARAALEILRERGRMDLTHRVARKALTAARNFVGPGPRLWMTIFDYDGTAMVSDQLAE
jgi:cobalt-precorrin-5B (C1)-methyltransferase